MGYSLRNVLTAAVWVAAGLANSGALAQSNPSASTQPNLRERLAAAVETVEGACAPDIQKFCGNVTRGEGRLVLCMQAHDDRLGIRKSMPRFRNPARP